MARFGLSPYANPIEAGVDTFAKMEGIFNDRERMKMEKEDAGQRRQMNDIRLQEAQRKIQAEDAEAPVRALELQARKLKAEHAILEPDILSATTKLRQGMKNPGSTPPELSAKEIAAVMTFNKEASFLEDDPEASLKQVGALHNLQGTMAKITPQLVEHAKSLPEGQRKVQINDQNAPGLVESFNVAFSRLLKGKQAQSFLLDMDRGTVVPVVSGEDGKPEPLTKGDQVHEIPMAVLNQYITGGMQFGNMLLPALAQLDGNDKLKAEVEKEMDGFRSNMTKAKVLDQIPSDATPAEARKKYTALMAKENVAVTPAEAKELFPDKTDKPTREIVSDKDSPTGYSYLTEQGNLLPGAQNPNAKEDRADRRLQEREDRADRRLNMREDRQDRRKQKSENDSKRRDKLINENLGRLASSPDWKGRDYAERRAEAERLADATIEGRSTAPPAEDSGTSALADHFKSMTKKNLGTFETDYDYEHTIKSAEDQGWTEQQIRAAAKKSANPDVKAAVEKHFSGKKPAAPAKKTMTRRSAADFD